MRCELSDYEWTAIKPMLSNKPRSVRRVNDRRVLNGIFWVLRSGAPWRDLPENYGPYTTRHGNDDGIVLRATGSQGGSMRPVSGHQASGREMLQRTAKSCGPDAPTLASSSRSCVGPTGLRQNLNPLTTVAKEPGHRGERDISC